MPSDLAVMLVNTNIQRGLVGSEYNTCSQQCEAAARDIDLAAALENDDFEITVPRVDLLVEIVSDVVGKEGGVRMTGEGIVALLPHDLVQPAREVIETRYAAASSFAVTVYVCHPSADGRGLPVTTSAICI